MKFPFSKMLMLLLDEFTRGPPGLSAERVCSEVVGPEGVS